MERNRPNETWFSYMNTVHALAIDWSSRIDRIEMGDPATSRIQAFDEHGTSGRVSGCVVDRQAAVLLHGVR